jgi:hypothetical protein
MTRCWTCHTPVAWTSAGWTSTHPVAGSALLCPAGGLHDVDDTEPPS